MLARHQGGARHLEVALDTGEIGDDGDFGIGEKLLVAGVGLEFVSESHNVASGGVTIRHAL